MFYFLAGWTDKVNQDIVSDVTTFERSLVGNILNIIRIAGTGLALIMLTIMAFGYFMSDGKSIPWSIEKKADIKGNQLFRFVFGVAIFIGASNIAYLIATFVMQILEAVVK